MTRALVFVAVAGLLLTGLGALRDSAAFLRAWLVAALTGIALPLGAMAVLMTHNLTGGQWGEPVRAPLKAVVATLPLMLVAFVPLLLGAQNTSNCSRPWASVSALIGSGFSVAAGR